MSQDAKRDILNRLRGGEITPDEAFDLLEDVETEADARPQAIDPPRRSGDITRVRVVVGVGRIDVVGDPAVAQAEVEGHHEAHIDGDTLEIRREPGDGEDDSFTFHLGKLPFRVSSARRGDVQIIGGPKVLHHVGARAGERLVVRMNPDLALDVSLDAGPLSITGVTGPIKAHVSAGPVSIEGFAGPLDVSVNAGAVRGNGTLTHGRSHVRSDAGAIRLHLERPSSVQISGSATLGKVVLAGVKAGRRGPGFPQKVETTIGSGTARLRVETAMGSVHVSADEEGTDDA